MMTEITKRVVEKCLCSGRRDCFKQQTNGFPLHWIDPNKEHDRGAPGCWYNQDHKTIERLRQRITELETALEPFAAMYREGDEGERSPELACQRGCASDMTVIHNSDWVRAKRALRPEKESDER
jgi:hypothetical protein